MSEKPHGLRGRRLSESHRQAIGTGVSRRNAERRAEIQAALNLVRRLREQGVVAL